jgi:hypothetical protein
MQRGPHQSSQGERKFVAEEMLDFCNQGYWLVLPYDVAIEHLRGMRVLPLGMVPQRDRRPRLIVGYTFWPELRDSPMGAARGHAVWPSAAASVLDLSSARTSALWAGSPRKN